MTYKRTGRPNGRTPKIDTVIAINEETGQPITVADRIVEMLERGHYWVDAVARAGVPKPTVNNWLQNAARCEIRALGRNIDDLNLTAHDLACLDFAYAVEYAEAVACGKLLDKLDELGFGGLEQEVVTETEERGETTKTTTTRRFTLPDRAALQWRLQHRWPEKFADRIEVVQASAGAKVSEAEHADSLVEAMSSYLQGVEDGSIVRAGDDVLHA